MVQGGKRRAGLSVNQLRRSLKELRDGPRDDLVAAKQCIVLFHSVSHGRRTQAVRELGMEKWIEALSSKDTKALAPNAIVAPGGKPAPSGIESRGPSQGSTIVRHPDVRSPSERPANRSIDRRRRLTAEHIITIHEALVEDFAGTTDPIDPPGVKHPDMLESAVGRQHTSLGGVSKYTTLAQVAATLVYGVALNHPFHNGNKRTAIVSLLCLADLNQLTVTATERELYEFVLKVVSHGFRPVAPMSASATNDAEVSAIAGWITQKVRRRGSFTRSVRWRSMKKILATHGAVDSLASGSQIEFRRGHLRTVVDFDGDTREVGMQVVRKIRRDLQLTSKDGCDDDVFYGEELPLDHFIAKYRTLLRDLASV